MKVGDLLLVTGTAFFEKTKIVDRNKGIYTLENGIKTDKTLHPLNSTYKVEPFDEEKYKKSHGTETFNQKFGEIDSDQQQRDRKSRNC